MNTRGIGDRYEKMAADYLVKKGYRIVCRNYRNKFGEIDIIAESADGVLVYTEVKYRSGEAHGTPFEAVGFEKRRRISRAAMWHFNAEGYGDDKCCRFDVIGIYGDGKIEHIENAFDVCR